MMLLLFVLLIFQTQPDTVKVDSLHSHSHLDSAELEESGFLTEIIQIQRIETKLERLLDYLNSRDYDLIQEAVASDTTGRKL